MKRQWQTRIKGLFRIILFSVLLFPRGSYADSEKYFENPQEIYERFHDRIYNDKYEMEYGFVKEEATLYGDCQGSHQVGKAKKYTGILVVSKTESYVQVIYETKKGYGIGWMERGWYNEIVRMYNGVEKQLLADGGYEITNLLSDKKYKIELEFTGDQKYKIKSEKGKYLDLKKKKQTYKKQLCWEEEEDTESQSWELIREYDHFYLRNKISGLYLTTKHNKLSLMEQEGTFANQFGEVEKTQGAAGVQWTISRISGKNVSPYRNFLQYDPDWAKEDYGNVSSYSGKMAAAGCGVVAITNAVYALNGQFIDPMLLADYAVEKNYRIIGSGTDDAVFKGAANKFGDAYGFHFVGRTYDVFKMRDYLNQGCVAISHVPGHYVTIADYREKNEKYLVLDSHPIPARPTSPFGDWFKWNRLESGGLASSCYYIYSTKEKEEQKNDVSK